MRLSKAFSPAPSTSQAPAIITTIVIVRYSLTVCGSKAHGGETGGSNPLASFVNPEHVGKQGLCYRLNVSFQSSCVET